MDSIPQKRCSKCGIQKPKTEFYQNIARNDGLSVYCRPCMNLANHVYSNSIKHKPDNEVPNKKECVICRETKPSNQFSKNKGSKDGLHSRCKNCAKLKSRQWKQQNAAHHQEYNHSYQKTTNGKTISSIATAKYRSKKQKLPSGFSKTDWHLALCYWNGLCAYCSSQQGLWNPICMEHFIPVDFGGSFTKENILPACKSCNSSKGNRNPAEWLNQKFGKRKAKQILDRVENYFRSLTE